LRSQSIELLAGKLKHEIGREAMAVTFDGFIEAKRGDTIDFWIPTTRSPGTTDPELAVFTIYAMFTCP
jgi:hypothetical protein